MGAEESKPINDEQPTEISQLIKEVNDLKKELKKQNKKGGKKQEPKSEVINITED